MTSERWQGRSPLEAFPVSIGLLGACAALFASTDLVFRGARGEAIRVWGMNMQAEFAAGELWRPLTAMFLHADVLHILLNMYALWQLCPALERGIGSARFSAIYFGAGLAGSLASLLFEPASLGASGAICGVMATYVRFERVALGSFRAVLRDPVGSQFLVWLLINIVLGFTVSRISNAGHIGGMLGGWAVSAAVVPALDGFQRGRLSKKPSALRCAAVTLLLAVVAAGAFRPLWNAGVLSRAAALASARGDTRGAIDLVERARRAPLARNPRLFFQLGLAEQEAGRDEAAAALYTLAAEAGLQAPALGHNQAMLLEKRGNERELLLHLRRWKDAGRPLPGWQDRLDELEAMEARGELGH
ncbi:MAG: rhomboid family intramembrane serine protease [Planctomycetia bacterium]|nr:rhomboid family intramembrane serine protease [Planctomycetia bacterium]